jgi:hypothetical protein
MRTTYLIEHVSSRQIYNYFGTLKAAKQKLSGLDSMAWNIQDSQYRILCLRGSYKYEGRHAYQVTYAGNCFFKTKLS